MATINPATVTDGETIDASDLNNPINTIADEINGNLDAENLANNAVTTAKIAAGAVTPNSLLASTGSSWVWQAWTPTLSVLDEGNGTIVARYTQIGKTVHFRFHLTMGSSGTAQGTNCKFSLPVPAHSSVQHTLMPLGNIHIFAGTSYAPGLLTYSDTDQAQFRFFKDDALSGAAYVESTDTIPGTFTDDGEEWFAEGSYEAA